jgi:pimeloyl-ACP methyl ester carboxylesterase
MIKKIFKITMITCVSILSLFLVSLFFGARYPMDKSAEEIEAKYLEESSSFINIDGVKIHYTDEGSGPVILLLHANYANLIDWKPWVETLSPNYRVIRLDIPGHGLTEADPLNDYSMPRTLFLIETLLNSLGIKQLSIAGASLGGTIGIHFARNNPETVDNLILVSPGALNKRVRGSNEPPKLPRVFNLITQITPRSLVKGLLNSGFGEPNNISNELVTRWHELLLREGQRDAQMARMKQYISGDIDSVIAQVRCPVLIMWGKKNKVVEVELADEMKRLLINSPAVETIIYENGGHQLVQELGTETATDAYQYLVQFNLRRT